jgi:hypothetical protein
MHDAAFEPKLHADAVTNVVAEAGGSRGQPGAIEQGTGVLVGGEIGPRPHATLLGGPSSCGVGEIGDPLLHANAMSRRTAHDQFARLDWSRVTLVCAKAYSPVGRP